MGVGGEIFGEGGGFAGREERERIIERRDLGKKIEG